MDKNDDLFHPNASENQSQFLIVVLGKKEKTDQTHQFAKIQTQVIRDELYLNKSRFSTFGSDSFFLHSNKVCAFCMVSENHQADL